jgi:hypothetical protein
MRRVLISQPSLSGLWCCRYTIVGRESSLWVEMVVKQHFLMRKVQNCANEMNEVNVRSRSA